MRNEHQKKGSELDFSQASFIVVQVFCLEGSAGRGLRGAEPETLGWETEAQRGTGWANGP